jgi:hypothetical protein
MPWGRPPQQFCTNRVVTPYMAMPRGLIGPSNAPSGQPDRPGYRDEGGYVRKND